MIIETVTIPEWLEAVAYIYTQHKIHCCQCAMDKQGNYSTALFNNWLSLAIITIERFSEVFRLES